MSTAKFDPHNFFVHADHVALHAGSSELFGFMRASISLPPQWAALVSRTTGDFSVVRPGGTVRGDDAASVLFVRVSPLEILINEEDLAALDRFQCRAQVRLRIGVMPERMELRTFYTSILGSRRVAKGEAIARYLQPGLRDALVAVAARHAAAALTDGGASEAVRKAVSDAVNGACFSAGLTLHAPPTIQFQSDALRQVRETEQEALRRRAEHEARRQVQEALERAQAEHLDHLSGLLTRLRDLAAASPDVALPELLRSFDEKQRGELYEAFFAAEQPASHTRWIVVAAGDELLYFDPAQTERPARRLTVSGPAGPVRSIQTTHDENNRVVLLLGAATGVYRVPIDHAEPDLILLVPAAPPVRGGFNAVACVDDRVLASHSELGLFDWRISEPNAPARLFESLTRQAKAIRQMVAFGNYLYASVDDRIIRWMRHVQAGAPERMFTGSSSTITALCPTADGVYAGNSDGDVLYWPADGIDDPERINRGSGRAVESAWLLEREGVRRIVYTDTSLRVHARVIGDAFSCGYEAGGQTLRRVEVAPDLIVATNDLRDRLLCWSPNDPARPKATIGVSSICGRSIQDACLVP